MKYCFKSITIPLSNTFTEYLLEDGVFMPEQEPDYEDQSDNSEEEEAKTPHRKLDQKKLVEEA